MSLRLLLRAVRVALACTVGVGTGTVAAAAERTPQGTATTPAGVAAVEVRVSGDSGSPVLDLKPAEVSLKVGNRPRAVRSVELVRFNGGPVTTDGVAGAPLPPPFASNRASDRGRTVVLVLEDESIPSGREQTVRDAIGGLLDQLSGRDLVSLLVVSRGRFDVTQTTVHDSVRASLATFVGRAARSETAEEAACRTQQAINAVKGVLGGVSGVGPTTVVLFSGGLAPPTYGGATARRGSGQIACDIRRELFDELSVDAHRAFADVYTVQIPTDMQVGTTGATDTVAGIENIAGITGNALIRLTGNIQAEMARIARETSAYYLVSFEPDPSDRTGSAVRVEVTIGRQNVQTRARAEVTLARAGVPTSPKAISVRDMLRVPTVYRDLPIRAVACPARDASDRDLKLVVLFEPFEFNVPFASAAVGLFDEKSKLVAQWTAQPADLASLPVMSGFSVKPGSYRMRVAATDGAGRAGTVDQDVTVALERGNAPVQMSALVLGAPLGQAFAPRLLFETEASALGYFEVYGTPKTANVTATIDIAASASGPGFATAPAKVGAPGNDGRRVVLGEIPIAALRPGDHLVRVTISVDGKPVGRVVRTLRKAGL
ncbi:MAG: hypothetical protein WCP29_04790 [Acidobacteriota bacterium]